MKNDGKHRAQANRPENDQAERDARVQELKAELRRIERGVAIRRAVINDLLTRKKAILAELGE